MKLSIVIVNYEVKFYLDQCLRSVLRAIDVLQASAKKILWGRCLWWTIIRRMVR